MYTPNDSNNHLSESEISDNNSNFYNDSTETKKKGRLIYEAESSSCTDFSKMKEERSDLANKMENFENNDSNSENSSNSSIKNAGKINRFNIIPNTDNFNKFYERNDYCSKDEHSDELLIKNNNETNEENIFEEINNNKETNINYSIDSEERKEKNKIEIEEKEPNENSFKKIFEDKKEIIPKMNYENINLKPNKKKNLNKNRKEKEYEVDEEDKNYY